MLISFIWLFNSLRSEISPFILNYKFRSGAKGSILIQYNNITAFGEVKEKENDGTYNYGKRVIFKLADRP